VSGQFFRKKFASSKDVILLASLLWFKMQKASHALMLLERVVKPLVHVVLKNQLRHT
jgi:hypothetical protein